MYNYDLAHWSTRIVQRVLDLHKDRVALRKRNATGRAHWGNRKHCTLHLKRYRKALSLLMTAPPHRLISAFAG